jgi:ribosomal-protein-alanine N-acetyltransferase
MGSDQRRPRVYLRAPAPSDRDELLALNRASVRLFRGVATPMRTTRTFALYLTRCRRQDQVGLLVCRQDDGAIVGSFTLSQIVGGPFKSAYMGYHVFAPFAGRGYMSAAMPLVLRHVFVTLKLHRVEANIQPTNRRSLALATGAGFSKEGYSPRYLKIGGRWRDHERWALLVEDWKRAKAARPGEASDRTQR